MKSHLFPHPSAKAKGFTLLELMVAMSVTVILLGMVTFMTGVSMDGYKGGRDKVLAGRQAKEALDAITKDFEVIVPKGVGMGLYADVEPALVGDPVGVTNLAGPANKKITNASRLIFFTFARDLDPGEPGNNSTVCYRLAYRDQISPGTAATGGTAANAVGPFPSFTLYRHLSKKGIGFDVKGETNLSILPEFDDSNVFVAENVVAENIYEMTVTFLVQTPAGVERITIGQQTSQHDEFTAADDGLKVDGALQDGDLVAVEINMTVLSERGLVMTEKGGMTREDIVKDYGIHYTHCINIMSF